MTGRPWLLRPAAALLLVVLVTAHAVSWPAQAFASCATREGVRSTWSFEGVVTAVRSRDRIASVRTDDGRTVEVRGGRSRSISSVDRTYKPGGRYEFHPLDASSPFQDNACTATRLLSVEPVPSSARTYPVGWAAGVVAGLLALAGAISVRRSRRHPPATAEHDRTG